MIVIASSKISQPHNKASGGVMNVINDMIIEEYHYYDGAHGIATYFPDNSSGYEPAYELPIQGPGGTAFFFCEIKTQCVFDAVGIS